MKQVEHFIIPFLILICYSTNSLLAQNRTCGSDVYHTQLMQNERYAEQFIRQRKAIKKKVAESTRSLTCTDIVSIPVAVHFNGGINDDDMQCLIDVCLAQIDVMNEDFAATNADISYYDDLVADCPATYPASALNDGACIEFCMAQYDHPASSGITDGDYAITVGEHSWPNAGTDWSGYMNIFVEDNTGGLGVAPLYGANDPDGNGFQVDAIAFGGPGVSCTSGIVINSSGVYNLGRTATHEAGHYFGLSHIFAGCSDGDDMPDTPNQSQPNYGTPDVDLSTCLSDAENTCSTEDYFFNYMDYVNDASMIMFTTDQATEMFATADQDQWNTTNCDVVTPVASFTPTGNQSICPGSEFTFSDTSLNGPTSWTWTITGPNVTVIDDTGDELKVIFNQSGSYTVTMTATNGGGSDTFSDTAIYTVLAASDPVCDVCDYELVMWDRREDTWSNGQSLDVSINGVITNYTGPADNNLSETVVLSLTTNDLLEVTVNTGSQGIDQMSYRVFDEDGYVVMGAGDTFGIGPGNAQSGNAPTLDSVVDGDIQTATVDCSDIGECQDYTLSLTLDNFPGETAWQILDDQGDYVYQSLGYIGQSGTVTENFCLPSGCYDLYFIDYWGDGICCNEGMGSYSLTRDSDNLEVAEGGEFLGSETTNFCVEDECPEDLVTDASLVTGDYVADNNLTSSGVVVSGETVNLYGGNTICLEAGFETPADAEFLAENQDCQSYNSQGNSATSDTTTMRLESNVDQVQIYQGDLLIYDSRNDVNAFYYTDGTWIIYPPTIKELKSVTILITDQDGVTRVD